MAQHVQELVEIVICLSRRAYKTVAFLKLKHSS